MWKSQLQGEITLSSTESEYIGLSYILRDTIPIMNLLDEMKSNELIISKTRAEVKCRVFENNSGDLEMAKVQKYRPRTKQINVKLHHFRDYVKQGKILIKQIGALDQLADYLTN